MKRDVGKFPVSEGLFMGANSIANADCLFVEYQDKQVVGRYGARIAGFVDKNRKLTHRPTEVLRDIKNAGGNPPALGGRLLRDDQIPYTTFDAGPSITPRRPR